MSLSMLPGQGLEFVSASQARAGFEAQYAHLPEVAGDIFADNPRASYLVAVAAVHETVLMPDAFESARVLRYNKYSELGWIDPNRYELTKDGRRMEPLDEHDEHAQHLVVVKNMRQSPARVIATARSIEKVSADVRLPVEHEFPEVLAAQPAPVGSNEVSRLISDSQSRSERALASSALQRAITNLCAQGNHGPTYAMIEGYLARRLADTHFPHELLTDFKPIAAYGNTENALMQTDWQKVRAGTAMFRMGIPLKTSLFFRGVTEPGVGFGYYSKMFLRQYTPQSRSTIEVPVAKTSELAIDEI